MNAFQEAHQLGQAIWLDYIRRGLLKSGELKGLIDLGISGLTANPIIMERAIVGSTDYDENETDEPGSILNLNAVRDGDSITWAWDNPVDSDFNMNIIYFQGFNVKNTSDSFYEAENLQPNTEYRIKIFTMDTFGNVNETEVADTVKTCISVCSYGQCDVYCPEDD